MFKNNYIRPTKFPFFFWAFNRAMKATFNTEENTVVLENKEQKYKYVPFPRWKFLLLKYGIFLFIFPIVLRFNDFSFSLEKIIQYVFAIAFTVTILVAKYNWRQFLLIAIFVLSAIVGFWTVDLWLTAYAIKYTIFFLLIVLFIVDFEFYAYSAKNNEKTIFNFLTLKKIEDLPNYEGDNKE